MMQITHSVQLAEMELSQRCGAIQHFCATAYPFFQDALASVQERRAEARKQDIETFGEIGENETYDAEEVQVAYEERPLGEDLRLVRLFALVYLVCTLEKFFQRVTESCGWKVRKGPGSNFNKFRSLIEKEAQFSFSRGPIALDYLEELFLARNEFVHNNGLVSEHYQQKAQRPRFAKDDEIV
ncbi:MAG: hypothetical protein ACE5H2_10440, partial [Terriglobia bacterium]